MALIVWNSDYDVGVDRLNADHIMIFSLINHIHDATNREPTKPRSVASWACSSNSPKPISSAKRR